ncbi:hypothetical protein [Streptomyces sp. NPDC017868]|uniref:hypothetical protein n=1 Tax=Streptomyces sp. NPDC017868 TaxID=3365014 RepID=UPI0037A40A77
MIFGLAGAYGVGDSMRAVSEGQGQWLVEWRDGPTVRTVRAAVERELPDLAPTVLYDRTYGDRTLLLGALRAAPRFADSHRPDGRQVEALAREVLADVAEQWSTATAREAVMVERLMAAHRVTPSLGSPYVDTDAALEELARRRGIGWLLEDPAPAADRRAQPDGAGEGLELSPIEQLTARYATGADRAAWDGALRPMPVAAAWQAVVDDDHVGAREALAALTLAAGHRATVLAELDAAETRLIEAARTAGASWAGVGNALGLTGQSAAERHQHLRQGQFGGTP